MKSKVIWELVAPSVIFSFISEILEFYSLQHAITFARFSTLADFARLSATAFPFAMVMKLLINPLTFSVFLYIVYTPSDLKEEYVNILATIFLSFLLGGIAGSSFTWFLTTGQLTVLPAILLGIYPAINYTFAGFTASVIAYTRKSKRYL